MTSQSSSYFPTSHPVPNCHLAVAEVNYGTVLPTVHCMTKYPYSLLQKQFRAQELCESRGGRSGLPVHTSKDRKLRSLLPLLIVRTVSTCGPKATLNSNSNSEMIFFPPTVGSFDAVFVLLFPKTVEMAIKSSTCGLTLNTNSNSERFFSNSWFF